MPRNTLVSKVMTADVVTLSPDDSVEEAARVLSTAHIGGAPVVDSERRLLGMLEDDDLIVQDARIHIPTVVTLLGAYLQLPSSVARFETELHKAVATTVEGLMSRDPATCGENDSVEDVATTLHERHLSRLAVVRDGRLVGIVSRGDLVRAIVDAGRDQT